MGARQLALAFVSTCLQGSAASLQTHKSPARCDQIPTPYKVVTKRKLPHLEKPFTQGFEFNPNGTLIETSGSFPPGQPSYIRGIDPETGATLWQTDEGLKGAFIEGITQFGNGHWFSTVYQEPHRTLEYGSQMKFLKSHPYYFDGWGFTHSPDGSAFLATNGSSMVMRLDPTNFEVLSMTHATCLCTNVPALNELELVDDFMGSGQPALLGNVYTSRLVLALDPETMGCIGIFSLDSLDEPIQDDEAVGYHVANGIAYRRSTDTYFLTGKNWESMFEVELHEDVDSFDELTIALSTWLASAHTAPGILSFVATAERTRRQAPF